MHLSQALAVVAKDSKTVLVPIASNIKPWMTTVETPSVIYSSSGLNGTLQSLIILSVFILLSGIVLLIYYWRKNGYPSFITGCGKCLEMSNRTNHKSQENSTFSFNRFSNERISHLSFPQSFEGFTSGQLARTEPIRIDSVLPASTTTNQTETNQNQVPREYPIRSVIIDGYNNDMYNVMSQDYKDDHQPYSCIASIEEHVYAVIEGSSDYEVVGADPQYANIGCSSEGGRA